MAKKTYSIKQTNNLGVEKTILEITIEQSDDANGIKYEDIQWDSKTGLVTAKVIENNVEKGRQAIPFVGKSIGKIQPGPFTADEITDIQYSYWYN